MLRNSGAPVSWDVLLDVDVSEPPGRGRLRLCPYTVTPPARAGL